jgi:redox-sensitive bicupin YhaK (pirin superfamily)
VHYLQIWIVPAFVGVTPRYQQKQYAEDQKRGRLCLVLSPDGADGSLTVNQDVRVYAGLFDGAEQAELELAGNRNAYVHVASGSVQVNGQILAEGDGMRIRQAQRLLIMQGEHAEVLVFDLRPNELPQRS